MDQSSSRTQQPSLHRRMFEAWGWGLYIGPAFAVLVVVGLVVAGLTNERVTGSGERGQVGTSSAADPIEQARVVLGGTYGYDAVKTATDTALSAAGEAVTNENRSRAWSSVLTATKDTTVRPMDVMLCVPDVAGAAPMSFSDAVGLCAAELSL